MDVEPSEEGAVVSEEGAVVSEEGAVVSDEGAVVSEEGAVVSDEGAVVSEDAASAASASTDVIPCAPTRAGTGTGTDSVPTGAMAQMGDPRAAVSSSGLACEDPRAAVSSSGLACEALSAKAPCRAAAETPASLALSTAPSGLAAAATALEAEKRDWSAVLSAVASVGAAKEGAPWWASNWAPYWAATAVDEAAAAANDGAAAAAATATVADDDDAIVTGERSVQRGKERDGSDDAPKAAGTAEASTEASTEAGPRCWPRIASDVATEYERRRGVSVRSSVEPAWAPGLSTLYPSARSSVLS